MTPEQISQLIDQKIAAAAQKAQYTVTRVPIHTHNGIDSPTIPPSSEQALVALPASASGVASPIVLNGAVVNDYRQASNILLAGTSTTPTIYVNPVPLVYGKGSGLLTMTGTPTSGATSATLTSAYPYPTNTQLATFANGDERPVTFTSGSTSISWTGGISAPNAGGTSLTTEGAPSSFVGGDAPVGTILIFTNPAGGGVGGDGTTLWARVSSIPDFTSGSFSLTASVSSGATSATLSSAWAHTSGTYWITFSSGEKRPSSFTEGGTSISFSATTIAASSTITVSAVGWYGIEFTQLIPT